MGDTSLKAGRQFVLVAIFSWATGLLSGVLLSAAWASLRAPKEPPAQYGYVQPWRPAPRPSASPTPDCPAYALWTSCDPIPRTTEGLEKALMSDAVGWIYLVVPERWSVKIDGVSYGQDWGGSRRRPIVPGHHVIDLFEHWESRHARCEVDILQGRALRLLVGSDGSCAAADLPDGAEIGRGDP